MNPITLHGPQDVLAVLPYQLGYHPRDALVVVALRRRAVGLVQRLDLPRAEHVDAAVAAMVPPLLREKPDGVLLVGYEDESGAATPVLAALRTRCAELGLAVLDTLVVRDERWYSPWCVDGCCPSDGSPLPAGGHTPAVAEFVGLEVAPLSGREELRALVAAGPASVTGPVTSRVRAQEAAGAERLSDEALRLWSMVLDVGPSRPPVEGLDADELATLARSLSDVGWRDALIAWIAPGTLPLEALDARLVRRLRRRLPVPAWAERPRSAERLIAGRRLEARLAQLCQAVPDSHAPALLTVLASYSWWRGDGTRTRVALERALSIDPGYRLALLLEHMVDLAVRPGAAEGGQVPDAEEGGRAV